MPNTSSEWNGSSKSVRPTQRRLLKSSNIAAVKPDATPEEINAVVNDVQGGGDQIFAQAVSPSISITVMSV